MKRLLIAVALALIALVAAPLATYADHDGYLYPATDWQVREIGPDLVWHTATESYVEDQTTLHLIKPTGQTGTSAETTNLGIEGDEVTVDVILGPDADAAAGAIRLFAYDHPDGDTLNEAPQQVAAAVGAGQLTLDTSSFAGPIGTLGLVYDASNASDGEVIFKNLQVDGETVSFRLHVEPEPDPAETETPGPDPDPTETEDPVAVPTSVPAGLSAGSWAPVNGAGPDFAFLIPLGAAIVVGIVLAVAGAIVFNRGTSK